MRKWFNIVIMALLWIVNLFVGTGLDSVYHVTQYTCWVVYLVAFVPLLIRGSQKRKIPVNRKQFYIFGGMSVLFIASSIINGFGTQATQYLWMFLLVYLLAKLQFSEKDLFWIGLIYGISGFVVLVLFSQNIVFGGWNENTIAMIGVFSFLVMLIPLYKERDRRSKTRIVVLSIVFAFFVNPTNSRSSILFMAVGVIFALGFLKRDLITKKGGRLTFFLLIPIIVALLTILVSRIGFLDFLDTWSYSRFGKAFFNGRDDIWANGFGILFNHIFIGTGNLLQENWHNSAITVLVVYGVLGYLFWLGAMQNILVRAYPYLSDYLVQGCFIGFIIIYFQQSVELGLVSISPSLIPYVMLGLMLGRIRYLKDECTEGST